MKKFFYLVFICLQTFSSFAINKIFEVPNLKANKDTIKLGEPFEVTLIYRHKPNLEVLFPDSSYNYAPFEFVDKHFFPTKSDTSQSIDSVVYKLTSFELGPELILNLPIFIFESGDTIPIYSDDIILNVEQKILQATQADTLKVNTEFQNLASTFNYPYLLIAFLILLVIGGIVFFFFRKKIMAVYYQYLCKRDYENFNKNYLLLAQTYKLQSRPQLLEEMLVDWKKYLQKLEKKPFASLTTKEISKIIDQNQVTSSLQNFDRAIYGGYANFEMEKSIHTLLETASVRYQLKLKELINAK